MTKSEKLTITTITAKAWLALHEAEFDNASNATSWAHYSELNSNKSTHGLRSEWASLEELCEALKIDMTEDNQLDPSVATIINKCFELSTNAWAIYSKFEDYPYCANQNEEEEEA